MKQKYQFPSHLLILSLWINQYFQFNWDFLKLAFPYKFLNPYFISKKEENIVGGREKKNPKRCIMEKAADLQEKKEQ